MMHQERNGPRRANYELVLTETERQEIETLGHRQKHGFELSRLLWVESAPPDNAMWAGGDDIPFRIPAHTAWRIKAIAEQCGYEFDGLSDRLRNKLTGLCESVVNPGYLLG